MSQDPTYAEYLALDAVLDAHRPRSDAHDETLFIVIHHVMELWMKLVLHELAAARRALRADALAPASKILTRVARAQQQLIGGWDVLATMTPNEFAAVRPKLGTSSGFQSAQNRLLEFALGQKDPRALAHQHGPWRAALTEALEAPSLYDEALQVLHRRGLPVPAERLERDWRETYTPHPQVVAAWAAVYREPQRWWDLYDLAEKLVDLDYRYAQWRFAHLKTVERIIGPKTGTGGSSGVGYLAGVVEKRFFPELVEARAAL